MSRFAKKKISDQERLAGVGESYSLGHSDKFKYEFRSKKGLSKKLVEDISRRKNEPDWMMQKRLTALELFYRLKLPAWVEGIDIDFEQIHYYLKPVGKSSRSWDDVPEKIKQTFDKIGVPEAEKKMLSGVSGQFDSEVVYDSLKKSLAKKGVVFLSMDEGLKQYPQLVREHFGKVVPAGDNRLAALNGAVWSGGSFIYVPKNVKVELPLQAYFRINSERAGQFERTLIIADEGSKIHYVEGCFTKGAEVLTEKGIKNIEEISKRDRVLTHKGRFKNVNYLQKRKFKGDLYKIGYYGDSTKEIEVTEEHPFLAVKRRLSNERNREWKREWLKPAELVRGDYLAIPVDKKEKTRDVVSFEVKRYIGRRKGFEKVKVNIPCTKDFFRLVGYYLAEGSISSGSYLNFSFSKYEREYIDDVKRLVKNVFGLDKCHESVHKKNNGISVVFCSVELCRIFENFGKKNYLKQIPEWMMFEDRGKQKELILGWFRGDGNYYKKRCKSGFKEFFRINTTSKLLALQSVRILRRIGVPAFINARDRKKENRRIMYTVGITGEWMIEFGKLVGVKIKESLHGKKRPTMFGFDGDYVYVPIRKIEKQKCKNLTVYNFGVQDDESYVACGVAVHNCSAPSFSDSSLHAAVVEVFVKKGAEVTYTTVQNWYKNVYNLVTKRAWVEEEGKMRWVDANLGSKLTVKYPACILAGRKARGEMLSIAFAGEGQHQDAGAKMIHLAADTSSQIISKSISKAGGRATYRGMVKIVAGAKRAKSKVVCDALILDEKSRSDTYPTNRIYEPDISLEHEAVVSKVGEEQLFYLMSRGIEEHEAESMIVNGFLEPVMREIPFEYAVEMNRLIGLEMEGSVG